MLNRLPPGLGWVCGMNLSSEVYSRFCRKLGTYMKLKVYNFEMLIYRCFKMKKKSWNTLQRFRSQWFESGYYQCERDDILNQRKVNLIRKNLSEYLKMSLSTIMLTFPSRPADPWFPPNQVQENHSDHFKVLTQT